MPAPKTKSFEVARGRTVTHEGVHHEAGAKLDLPQEEGERLQALGFLLSDDGAVVVPQTEGPAVSQGDEIRG